MNPRSEPLLWLQLVALGAIPLELLVLLLVLAGADPGPLPGLERLLVWAIGGLGTALLLWRRPADVCSLLLLQVPLAARTETQRRLSAVQSPLALKLLMAAAAAAELPLFWWIDQHAALASPLTPLATSPRMVCLLLATPILALLLWQWQQLSQAIALLSRPPASLATITPLSPSQLESQRLPLGLPLLLLAPLQLPPPAVAAPVPHAAPVAEPASPPDAEAEIQPEGNAEPSADVSVAVEPEQAAEEPEGAELDQEIS